MIRTLLLVLALVAEILAGVSPGGLMVCVHRDGSTEVELAVASCCPDCCAAVAAACPSDGRAQVVPPPASDCAGCHDESLALVRLPMGARKIDLDVTRSALHVMAYALPPDVDAASFLRGTSVRIERVRPPPDPPPLIVRTVAFRV